MAKRVNIVGAICGGRGTGKSTFVNGDPGVNVKGIIPTYLKRDPNQKILIVDTFDSPFWAAYPKMEAANLPHWKKGVYRLFSSNTSLLMETIERECYNTVIFFEDATKFIGSRLSDDQKKFILDSKQKNLDLFFIFHSMILIPNDLIRFSDYLTLFKTNESWTNQHRNKFPFPELETTFNEVKDHPSRFFNKTIRVSD